MPTLLLRIFRTHLAPFVFVGDRYLKVAIVPQFAFKLLLFIVSVVCGLYYCLLSSSRNFPVQSIQMTSIGMITKGCIDIHPINEHMNVMPRYEYLFFIFTNYYYNIDEYTLPSLYKPSLLFCTHLCLVF